MIQTDLIMKFYMYLVEHEICINYFSIVRAAVSRSAYVTMPGAENGCETPDTCMGTGTMRFKCIVLTGNEHVCTHTHKCYRLLENMRTHAACCSSAVAFVPVVLANLYHLYYELL
jgi:hypothetical protein